MKGSDYVVANDAIALQSVKNAANGSIPFTAVSYTQADIGNTYFYVIKQVAGTENGMAYASPIHVSVTITDAGGGVLNVVASYVQQNQVFTNTYTASGSWIPEITKVLIGRDINAEEFSFRLMHGEQLEEIVTNDTEGKVVFSEIMYTREDIGKSYN